MNKVTNSSLLDAESDCGGAEHVAKAGTLAGITVVVRPWRIARALVALVLLIVIVGTVANIVIYNIAPSSEHELAKLMKRFDLGHEPSIPNWYSSIALLAASLLLAVVAKAERIAASADSRRWAALSVLALLLAVDEAVMIHEMLDAPLHAWLNTGGPFYFAWVIPYAGIVLVVGGFFVPFLRRLDVKTRRLFEISALMFVMGAIGVELIEGLIVEEFGVEGGFTSLRLTFAQMIEEALEMFAVVLLIYAILDYIKRHIGRCTFEMLSVAKQYDANDNRHEISGTPGGD